MEIMHRNVSSSSSFMALQFLKNLDRAVVSTTPRPKPAGSRLHLVWLLPFDLSGLGDPATRLRSRQHSSRGHQSSQASQHATRASTRWPEIYQV